MAGCHREMKAERRLLGFLARAEAGALRVCDFSCVPWVCVRRSGFRFASSLPSRVCGRTAPSEAAAITGRGSGHLVGWLTALQVSRAPCELELASPALTGR